MIAAIIQKLEDDCPTLKSVGAAVDLADLMANKFAVPDAKRPAAFVMMAGVKAGPNVLAVGGVHQVTEETVAITIAVGSGDVASRAVKDDVVTTVRDAVLACLLGWVPEAEHSPLTYGGQTMLGFRPRVVWFQMVFNRAAGVASS